MPRRPRRDHSPAFKAKAVLAAIRGDRTVAELSDQFDVHANQITQWKSQLLKRAVDAFKWNHFYNTNSLKTMIA